jgi:Domain of unknown function (DUF4145)
MPPEEAVVKSQNFEFLRPRRAVLADLAAFAEEYVHSDPASSLIKQRGFVEQAVLAIYDRYGLRLPYSDNLNDLLNSEELKQAVPNVVLQKLHAVRVAGNHAAHPRKPIPGSDVCNSGGSAGGCASLYQGKHASLDEAENEKECRMIYGVGSGAGAESCGPCRWATGSSSSDCKEACKEKCDKILELCRDNCPRDDTN